MFRKELGAVLSLFVMACLPVGAAHHENVTVVMNTSQGEIRIELFTEQAPVTSGNFLKLVDGGHFDGTSFYRVVTYENDNGNPKIEVIQGGLGDRESPFEPIAHESTKNTGLLHTPFFNGKCKLF